MKKTLFFYLCILCWLVVPNLGYGQISIASSSSAAMSNSSNFSMVYSSASGTNQVLLVGVSAQQPYSQMNSITYGGFALTKLISVMNTGQTRVEIWYLLNPPSGSSQLILNNSSNENAVIGVTTFNNVSQASPFDTSVTNLGNGSIASLNVPSASRVLPSRTDCTLKYCDKAFTALVPTPFSPTDFLKARVSYFPPVFILDTASIILPSGMPRP